MSGEIKIIIKIAKGYVLAGYDIGQAIKQAQKEYRETEIEMYEK